MDKKGFTIVELVVVIAIISVLLSLATISFSKWSRKNNIESQAKTIYADLMNTRAQALYQKNGGQTVKIVSRTISTYSPIIATTDTTTAPTRRTALTFSVATSLADLQIDFDQDGVATINGVATNDNSCICIQPRNSDAAYDSIVVSRTNIELGKLNGTGCSSANIRPQ